MATYSPKKSVEEKRKKANEGKDNSSYSPKKSVEEKRKQNSSLNSTSFEISAEFQEAAKNAAMNPELSASGWQKYLDDLKKSVENKEKAKEEESFWEKIGRYLSNSTADTTLPTASTAQVIHSLSNDTSHTKPSDDWDEEQKTVFGYLYSTDPSKAYKYAEATNIQIKTAAEEEAIRRVQESATSSFGAGLGHTVGAIASAPLGLADYLNDLVLLNAGRDITPDGQLSPFEYSQAVTSGVSTHLNQTGGVINESVPIIGGKGWGDVYGLGTSIAQSMVSAYTLGGAGTLISYFGQGAASAVDDALSRGATEGQAVLYGTALGVFEGLAEMIGVDRLFKLGSSATIKGFIKNILNQAGAEGFEEGITSFLSNIADNAIMQDKSNFNALVAQYVESGMDVSKAKLKAWLATAGDIAFDTIAGSVSGGVSGSIHTTAQNIAANKEAKEVYGTGRNLVGEAFEGSSDGSNAKALAEKYQKALDGGKNLSGAKINLLAYEYDTDLKSQDTAKIKAAVEARLTELGETGDIGQLAEIITKHAKGEKLSATEQSIIRGSYAGQRVANEITPKNIASGEYTSEWAEKIGTKRINAGAYNKALYDLAMEQAGVATDEETTSATVDSTPTKEIAPEAKNTVSDDGKTVLIETGEEVTIQGIASIENGKVKLRTNKGEVDSKDISFGTDDEALLYEAVTDMSAEAARNMVEAYDPSAGVSMSDYVHGFKDAYKYGYFGFPETELSKGTFTKDLSYTQTHRAYVVGKNAGEAAVKEAQSARTAAKKGDNAAPKKGKVYLNGKEYTIGEKTGLSGIRDTSVKGMVVLAEALGVDIHFYESYVKDGKRVYRDENGDIVKAPHGFYDASGIHIDLNAGKLGEGLILYTAAHELTHFIREWSPAKFKVFADFLLENYGKKGVTIEALVQGQIQKARKNDRVIDYDTAYEEVIADSCQAMLADGKAIQKLGDLKAKDATLWNKIKDFISSIVAKIRKAYEGLDPYSDEGRFVKQHLDVFEQLQSMWIDALVDAGETYSEVRDALGEDSTIKVNEDGEFLMGETNDGKILFNDRTWDEGGREILRATLALEGYSEEDIDAAMTIMDGKHALVEQLNKEFTEQDKISKATLTTDVKNGKAVLSALVSNGDYPVNIDLLMVCKKRQAYQRVINRLCETGLIKQATLDALAIAEINKILGGYGFETACLGCFVESRRIRIQEWAETICKEWNDIVDKMVGKGKAASFNFAEETFVKDLSNDEIEELSNDLDAAYERDGLHYGRMKVVKKMEQLLREVPSLRKHLSVADLITPQGRTHLKQLSSELNSLVACRYGSNTPKIVQDFNPYNHELAQYGTVPTKYKSLREYLYAIGGARMQSFSDFIVENWFDYCQIVADLAARKLPMHTYTKEIVLAKLFGMTGIKINLSLIPDIDKSMGKEYAGLTRNANGELELIWGDKDRYKATGGKSYMQSINFADALELMADPRYSSNVGTIAVGVSDMHIRMMLDDPRIRMIIPYHSSGMNPIFANLVGTEYYTDYTNDQNPTVRQLYDSKGNKVTLKLEKEQKAKLTSGFDFNAVLQELGDARATAKAYLEWCADASKHSITIDGETYTAVIKPEFEQFSDHENYYKVLEDFNTYDCITEQAAPQGDVQQIYPDEFEDVLRGELTVRENYRQKQEPKWEAAMGEIESYLKKHTKKETLAYAKEHGIKLTAKDKKLSDRDSEEALSSVRAELEKVTEQEREAKKKLDSFNATEQQAAVVDALTKDGVTDAEKDRVLAEYNKWSEESGYSAAYNAHETLRKRREELYREQQQMEKNLSKQILSREYTPEEVKWYVSKAVRKFHTTSRFKCAAYLLTTGSMLDFSEGQGYRVKDHREIAEILDLPEYAQYSDGMIVFMNMGNIRLQTYGVDIASMPNDKQISALRGIISEVMRESDGFTVDFSKPDGKTDGSVEYPKGVSSSRIISDIRNYFETGNIPEYNSSLSQFRYYSDRVTDQETLDFLENQEHVTVYRAMQLIDGKLYPPMNAYTYDENGKKVLMPPSEIGAWEQSVERPDLIDPKTGKFKLDKGKVDSGKRGTAVPAAYNPYIHTSLSMLNDQFTSAYQRSNLVVVKGVVPKSELTSGYRAQYAKDTVGETEWHSGVVSTQLPESRKVILSRWFKPVEIMSDDAVAKGIKKMLGDTGIEIPYNVVSPKLRRSLEKIGVPIGEGRGIRNLPAKNAVKYSDRSYHDSARDFVNYMHDIVKSKNGKFYGEDVFDYLEKHPELSFIDRILKKDKTVKADLESFLNGIDNESLIKAFFAYMRGAYWRSQYRGAVRTLQNAVKKRLNEIESAKVNGTNLGVENGDVSLDDIKSIFDRLNSDKEVGALAERVFATSERLGVNIRFANQMFSRDASGDNIGDMVEYKTSYFNDRAVSDQRKASTLLHELIHACTIYAMSNNLYTENAGTALEKIYDEIKNDPDFRGAYGIKDAYEMVAELSNPRFVSLLKKKSLWQGVLDWICNLFGFRRGTTAYDNAMQCLDHILDNPDVTKYRNYANKQRTAAWADGYNVFGKTVGADGKTRYSDRDSYAPVFYSHMGKTIDDIKLAKMGAGGVVPYLKGRGVKDEEIKWSGIEAFLEGKKSVTKEELQEFVAGSQLQIVEQMSDDEENTHWSEYKLDGGSNYRELVFQMPNSSYSNIAMQAHWGDEAEGVLAHARMQDMDTADGKMLFIEEIQSDWHNAGAKYGYRQQDGKTERLLRKESEAAYKKFYETVEKMVYDNSDWETDDSPYYAHPVVVAEMFDGNESHFDRFKFTDEQREVIRKMVAEETDRQEAIKTAPNDNSAPYAPFRDTYHEYVMKRLIRMAAEEGYDIIGWTPSEIQVDRWSEEYAEGYRIEYDQEIPKFLKKYGKKWGATVGKTALELGEYTDEAFESDFRSTWEGRWSDSDNVEFDSYYNDDGSLTVRATNHETGEVATSTKGGSATNPEVWSMPITDSMRQSVLREGQPLYSDRDNVGYHAGDLGKSEYYHQQGYSRGTGHFGTGTYFVGEEAKINDSTYGGRPHHAVDFSDYNLYKIKNDEDGYKLHDQLKVIDGGLSEEWLIAAIDDKFRVINTIDRYDIAKEKYGEEWYTTEAQLYGSTEFAKKHGIEIQSMEEYAKEAGVDSSYEWLPDDYLEYVKETIDEEAESQNKEYAKLRDVYFPLWLRFGKSETKRALWETLHYQKKMNPTGKRDYHAEKREKADSLATVFMKSLGYEGIDVRGTNLDNTTYGSVIYDLKNDTVLYSDRSDSDISNRELLANALEAAATNDIERNKLAQYKQKIALINAEEKKLHELKAKIGELSFAKGRKDVEQIRKLQFEAKQAENRINTYDRQLLNLEASAPLKAVLDREKKLAFKKAEKRGKDALAAYREKAAADKRKLLERAAESRLKGIEGRRKTEMRHKIKKVVSDLDHLLRHGSKERNVKLGLQAAVASALEAVNMDTVAADERIAALEKELMQAKTPEKIQEISRRIDHIRDQGDRMKSKLEALRQAYVDIKTSEEGVPDYYKNEAALIADKVDSVMKKVGDTPLRNMSLAQLEEVHNLYKMVLTTVRNVNSLFVHGKLDDLHQNVSEIMTEEEAIKPLKEERLAIGDWWRKQAWSEMIPVYAFEKLGSKKLMKFFWETIKGQNTFAVDVNEAKEFSSAAREKYGYSKWDLDKIHEFKVADGRTFRLSLRHMMSIYAYSKREQALDHMSVGGFFFNDKETFRKEKGVLKVIKSNEAGYKVNGDLLAEITAAMEKEAEGSTKYVDEMQEYLTKMGAKGNEVSRVLWGIDIFKEKVYFPLKSSRDFIYQANQPAQESSLKNDGMTKEIVPHASNPIVLESFDDVWASHVERMSKYHAFVLPIENLNKIMNYGTWIGTDSLSVSTMIRARHSDAANEYVTQFIRDLNGASSMGGVTNPVFGFFNKFKKTAVAASASVVVQQPTAILRALAVMDAKHFIGMPSVKKLATKWDELQKYAPIAIIKDIGGFDAGGGRQVSEWLNADTKRGLDKAMGKLDDITMLGAALGDQIGWTTIWEAVKREIKSTTNLKEGSEEFLQKAGERFTEVIVLTQVYDSTLSRSGFMRSKHESVKMMTSFMGEPTVSFNMLMNAVLQVKDKKITKRQAARTIGAVYASVVAASIAASMVYALRDDDDDESYLEKLAEQLSGKLKDEVNPINMLPIMRDIMSIMDGWDVERTDVAIFKDIKDAFDGLSSENKSTWRKIEDFAGALASVFGIPAKNMLRTGREIYNLFENTFDGVAPSGVDDAFVRGITGEKKNKSKALYEAIVNSDDARLEVYREGYKSDKSYETAVRSALREYDPRIKEAARAIVNEDFSRYTRLVNQIIGEKNFSEADIVSAIKSEVNAMTKDDEETEEAEDKEVSIYEMDYFYSVAFDGDAVMAEAIREDIIRTKVANGKEREEAEKSFNSSFQTRCRKEYEEGNLSDSEAIRMLVTYGGKTEKEARSRVQAWSK